MKLARKALSALGGIFLAALLILALAPKATRGIAAALVQVVNTTSNPANVSESQANAYASPCNADLATDTSCSIPVPAGKRFVVQTVSFDVVTNAGVRVTNGAVLGTLNGTANLIEMLVPFSASAAGFDSSVTTQEVRFYVDGSSGPLICNVDLTAPQAEILSAVRTGTLWTRLREWQPIAAQ
jgi:hypothetical protein